MSLQMTHVWDSVVLSLTRSARCSDLLERLSVSQSAGQGSVHPASTALSPLPPPAPAYHALEFALVPKVTVLTLCSHMNVFWIVLLYILINRFLLEYMHYTILYCHHLW